MPLPGFEHQTAIP